jgi:hypothetical protein
VTDAGALVPNARYLVGEARWTRVGAVARTGLGGGAYRRRGRPRSRGGRRNRRRMRPGLPCAWVWVRLSSNLGRIG